MFAAKLRLLMEFNWAIYKHKLSFVFCQHENYLHRMFSGALMPWEDNRAAILIIKCNTTQINQFNRIWLQWAPAECSPIILIFNFLSRSETGGPLEINYSQKILKFIGKIK